jgi:hypothetical protein
VRFTFIHRAKHHWARLTGNPELALQMMEIIMAIDTTALEAAAQALIGKDHVDAAAAATAQATADAAVAKAQAAVDAVTAELTAATGPAA